MANKYLDTNGLLYFWAKLREFFVTREAGKGLSANDYTDAEKGKLAELKAPVDNLSSMDAAAPLSAKQGGVLKGLVDGIEAAGYQTASDVSAYVLSLGYQTEAEMERAIEDALAGVAGISLEVVETLPETGTSGVIYLVAKEAAEDDVYDEYIWVDTAFEKIGTTSVDLSGYWTKSSLVALTNGEIDTVLAS